MKEPIISVIVPIYNTEKYIKGCVELILKQDYKNIQIVLVDDGSADNSPHICDSLADGEKIIVLHQKNQGIFQTRINGVRASRGEYVGFVDSDDIIEPDMFKTLVKNAIENDADISHCGYKMIQGEIEEKHYGTNKKLLQTRNEAVRDLFDGAFIEPSACTKLYKRELLENIHIPYRIDNSEDLLLNFLAFSKAKKTFYEDVTPYHYVRRVTSYCKSTDMEKQFEDIDKVMNIIIDKSKDDKEIIPFIEKKRVSLWIQRYHYYIRNDKNKAKEFRKKYSLSTKFCSIKQKLQIGTIKVFPAFYNKILRSI